MHRPFGILVCLVTVLVLQAHLLAQNVSNYSMIADPTLFLLREPAVHSELKLSTTQHHALTAMNESFDADLLASRTWDTQRSQERVAAVLTASNAFITEKLQEGQQQRFQQILYRTRGIRFVLMPAAAAELELTDKQRVRIEEVSQATSDTLASLQKQLQAGEIPADELQQSSVRLQVQQQQQILAELQPEQQQRLVTLIGEGFDLKQLGQVRFKAPEVTDGTVWLQSKPLTMSKLRGQVVAVHFWTHGCINCIRNYPWYREWTDAYADEGLVILGVHTPEFESEHDVERIQAALEKEHLEFPVVVDNEKKIWTRWGNSMWPSVYLVDKHGRLRYWWYGELNWQNAGGQLLMARRIEELLAEPAPTSRPGG